MEAYRGFAMAEMGAGQGRGGCRECLKNVLGGPLRRAAVAHLLAKRFERFIHPAPYAAPDRSATR